MHQNQLAIAAADVRILVDAQFPQWRELTITEVASGGTVNALFRIGDLLAARFLLQGGDAAQTRRWLQAEAAATRELLGRTRFATPELVAIGEPGAGYPLAWSVQTWLTGTVGTDDDPCAVAGFAHDLAEFIVGVRSIDVGARTFSGSGRGGHLASHDEWMARCFQESERLMGVALLRCLWATMRELPRRSSDVMTHGDLNPSNVLVSEGRLVGVIDVGGLGAADPALDLVCAWTCLAGPREALRCDLGCDDLDWDRGRAWAFEQAMGLVWYYEASNPLMSSMGRRTLRRIIEDLGHDDRSVLGG